MSEKKHTAPPRSGQKVPRGRSIGSRLLAVMLCLVLMQALILGTGLVCSGPVRQLRENACEDLYDTLSARTDYLQYDFLNRWCAVDAAVEQMNSLWKALDDSRVSDSYERRDRFLAVSLPYLLGLLRTNNATGTFLVLRSGALPENSSQVEKLAGLHLRAADPGAQDLRVELMRAPVSLTETSGLSKSSGWRSLFTMNQSDESERAFFVPYADALAHPELSWKQLAYWATPYVMDGQSEPVISYSVPLRDADGAVYGVLGIEIEVSYLARQLPAEELEGGAYAILCQDEEGGMELVAFNGARGAFDAEDVRRASLCAQTESFGTATLGGTPCTYSSAAFGLYEESSENAGQQWLCYAIVPDSRLYSSVNSILSLLAMVVGASLILGAGLSLILARRLSRPVARLEAALRSDTAARGIESLPYTGITEIDHLVHAVEVRDEDIRRNENQLTRLLEMSSTKLGAFEADEEEQRVFSSADFFAVMGRPDLDGSRMSCSEFLHELEALKRNLQPGTRIEQGDKTEGVYRCFAPGQPVHWVRLRTERRNGVLAGFAEDITAEWNQMQKLAFERDHDALTGLINRRAFYQSYYGLFRGGQHALGCAALVMLDLDNLKYINDTYGHDYGDRYLRAAAQVLCSGTDGDALVARMSGDEFVVFLFGEPNRTCMQVQLDRLRDCLRSGQVQLPDGTLYPVRASAGVAWYPTDSDDPERLIRYADFAMYKVKHSVKGGFASFDAAAYRREAFLLSGSDALNRLIEQKLVHYAFQPIVDLRTGEIFAYEALMRSDVPELASPADVLSLARQEAKLGAIEQLTWEKALEDFELQCNAGGVSENCRLFINSISNQICSDEVVERLLRRFRKYLPRIVVEHTEEEQPAPEILARKRAWLRRMGAQLALDDFGSGYNGDNLLILAEPDYVKMDVTLVRGVDADEVRRSMVEGVLRFCHSRGIGVIAEAVETEAELNTLASLGVDYVQGYLVARPAAIPPLLDAESVRLLSACRKTGALS